jgi:Tol biopolymer transport system component
MPIPTYFSSPVWHPLENWIAIEHTDSIDTDGDTKADSQFAGIWLIHAETGEKNPFLRDFSAPDWHPDGINITVGRQAQIYTITINNLDPIEFDIRNLKQLTSEGRNFFPSWNPSGNKIAYDSDVDSPSGLKFIWIMDADGNNKRRIAYQPTVGEMRKPNWSPKGDYIVFETYTNDAEGYPEIAMMDTLGINIIRLTDNNHFDNFPKFSPDGLLIGYISKPKIGPYSIWVMNYDGGNKHKLSMDYSWEFDWSPDGSRIAYVYWDFLKEREGNGQIWIMNADGSNIRQLTHYKE